MWGELLCHWTRHQTRCSAAQIIADRSAIAVGLSRNTGIDRHPTNAQETVENKSTSADRPITMSRISAPNVKWCSM
jgi:hypothetical protein